MIIFDNTGITVRLAGLDEESHMELIKTILYLLGNQRTESPLTPSEVGLITHMVSEMLPDSSHIKPKIKAA